MSKSAEKLSLFKKTEYALYNYKHIDVKIKSIEIDIESLKNDITLKAIKYEEKTASTNAYNSSVENEVIRREETVMKEIVKLEKDKYLYQQRKEKIKLALECLAEEDRKLIELRYFSNPQKTWLEISFDMNIDKDKCCKMRKKLINILSYYIFNV